MTPADGLPPADAGRRDFLRTGLLGTLALSTVSFSAVLSGCASAPPARGLRVFRDSDLPVLRAVMPVVLAGAMPTDASLPKILEESIQSLDALLAASSHSGQKQVQQLFDLLTFPPTRYAVAGLDTGWANASPEAVNAFLDSWRQSRFGLLRGGYIALCQMMQMNWYLQPRSWAALNYMPPRVYISPRVVG